MANPHWRVWVDWNGNGIWDEPGEDVTADLMRLHWEWGRDLRPDHAGPGLLELTLRNGDHRYSPPNGGSPLAGGLKPGREVWAQFAYPYDDFTGADGSDLAGRPAAVDSGFAWVKQSFGANGFQISGNQVTPVTRGGGDAIYTLDLGDADAGIGFKYQRASNALGGVALRCVNAFDYLRVRFGDNGTVLQDVTGAGPPPSEPARPLAAGVNYFVEIEMHGPSIRLMATDLDSGTMQRRTILDGQGSAGNAAATRHGLWHAGRGGNDRWDDFGGWRSFFYGRVDSIVPHPHRTTAPAGSCLRRVAPDGGKPCCSTCCPGPGCGAGAIAGQLLSWSDFSSEHRLLDDGRALVADQPRSLWRIPSPGGAAPASGRGGRLTLRGRHGILPAGGIGAPGFGSHTVSRATFRGRKDDSPYFSDLSWDDGSDGVENDVTFRYRRGGQPGIAGNLATEGRDGHTRRRVPGLSGESAAYDLVDGIRVPSATTDYAANSRADGSGDDLTGSLAVSLPLLSAISGRGTVVRVSNSHPTATACVTFLRLRADRAYRDLDATIYQAEDAVSRGVHGHRSRLVSCLFLDNYAAVRDAAEARLELRKARRTRLRLTLPNGDRKNLLQMVHRKLSDRITVVYPDMGIDADFFIEGMELDAEARTGEVTLRWLVQGV